MGPQRWKMASLRGVLSPQGYLTVCLLILHIDFAGFLYQGLCRPQEAYSQWLRGDGPSTGPCTPTHNPSLGDTEPLGSTLASEFALAVLLARGALSFPPLCHPDSSSFRTGFRCFLFQKLSLSSWLRCPGLPRSSPQIPPLQHGAHNCHHLVSGHLKLQALGETQRLHRDNAHSPAERDPGGKGAAGEGVGNV